MPWATPVFGYPPGFKKFNVDQRLKMKVRARVVINTVPQAAMIIVPATILC
jgi:hypothetical protein